MFPFMLFSCNSNEKTADNEETTKKEEMTEVEEMTKIEDMAEQTPLDKDPNLDPDFEYVHLIPDSLRTEEQNKFLNDLQALFIENIKADKYKMEFTLSEEEFVAKGFPKEYYTLLQKSIEENNKFFKENNIENVNSIIDELHIDLY